MPVPSQLDHLVFAAPDLRDGVARLESLFGARALPGGTHPAWGTRNALFPLSPTTYLEVIGPDPETEPPPRPEIFGLASLTAPRLVTWAARGRDLAALIDRARTHGIELGPALPGRRLRPDGTALAWELTDPLQPRDDGLLPFFIDWLGATHPGAMAPAALELVDMSGAHPDPDRVRNDLWVLGLDLPIGLGPGPALFATLVTPRGTVTLT